MRFAPSGESYGYNRRPGGKYWQPTAGYLPVDCLYTVISSGLNAQKRVRENFAFLYRHDDTV